MRSLLSLVCFRICISSVDNDNDCCCCWGKSVAVSSSRDSDKIARNKGTGCKTQQLATTTGPAMQPAPPESSLPMT